MVYLFNIAYTCIVVGMLSDVNASGSSRTRVGIGSGSGRGRVGVGSGSGRGRGGVGVGSGSAYNTANLVLPTGAHKWRVMHPFYINKHRKDNTVPWGTWGVHGKILDGPDKLDKVDYVDVDDFIQDFL